jgi:hypothetical protein
LTATVGVIFLGLKDTVSTCCDHGSFQELEVATVELQTLLRINKSGDFGRIHTSSNQAACSHRSDGEYSFFDGVHVHVHVQFEERHSG